MNCSAIYFHFVKLIKSQNLLVESPENSFVHFWITLFILKTLPYEKGSIKTCKIHGLGKLKVPGSTLGKADAHFIGEACEGNDFSLNRNGIHGQTSEWGPVNSI